MFLNISKWSKIRWKIRQYIESSKVKVLQGRIVKSKNYQENLVKLKQKQYFLSDWFDLTNFSSLKYVLGNEKKRTPEFSSNYNNQLCDFLTHSIWRIFYRITQICWRNEVQNSRQTS